MSVKLNITVSGDAPAQLRAMAARGQDQRPAWEMFGAYMLRSVEKNFRAGGRPNPWIPSKKKAGKTLIDTARLKNSIGYEAGATSVEVGTNVEYARIHQLGGEIRRPGGGALLLFNKTRNRFARQTRQSVDQFVAGRRHGRIIQRGPYTIKIPARPYLVIQDEDFRALERFLGEHIVGPQGGTGAAV